jgi:flagellar hook protein FlgE
LEESLKITSSGEKIMLRSMFTAISSLNLHQSYLDVVANNLANANTVGFKSNRMLFQDQFAQTLNPGAAPSAVNGGINPTQIGLGVQVGNISPVFTQGALQSTGRNLDLAVQGDGFFIYKQGNDSRYSREGSLALDSNGLLVNSSTGMRVQGWVADATGKVDPNLPVQDITIPANRTIARATANSALGGNLSADVSAAGNLPNSSVTVTMGGYDALGNQVSIPITFTRGPAATPNAWTWTAPGGAAGNLDFSGRAANPAAVPPVTAIATGHLDPAALTSTGTITVAAANGAPQFNVKVNFGNMTQLDAPNSAAVTTQDGLPAGNISDVYITPNDGGIFLVYTNGMREEIGQVAVARFANSAGLIRAGHTMFQQGLNSGEPQVGVAGSGGRGPIAAGYLEGSNVDMAQEFTNMILAQRGFQASSRVITTSDEIIQELVNLKR